MPETAPYLVDFFYKISEDNLPVLVDAISQWEDETVRVAPNDDGSVQITIVEEATSGDEATFSGATKVNAFLDNLKIDSPMIRTRWYRKYVEPHKGWD